MRGIAPGRDTIRYIVTNACGIDTAIFSVKVRTAASCVSAVGSVSNAIQPSMSVYPDPNKGTFTVNVSSLTNQDVHIAIADITGRKIKTMTIPANRDAAISINVQPGMYFLSAEMKEGHLAKKIIVE